MAADLCGRLTDKHSSTPMHACTYTMCTSQILTESLGGICECVSVCTCMCTHTREHGEAEKLDTHGPSLMSSHRAVDPEVECCYHHLISVCCLTPLKLHSVLLSAVFWELNSQWQGWQRLPSPAEQSHWPLSFKL